MTYTAPPPPFTFHQGTQPLLVSMPHAGTYVPPALAARFTDEARQVPDTDWHMERLYAFAKDMGASILVAGPSFGVGSSREHAVWAIQQYGFDAVIAPSFSDIFRNNCTKNGLAPVVLPQQAVERLWDMIEADAATEITIDMERLTVEVPSAGFLESFPMDVPTQHRFLNGLDDIGITLTHAEAISAFEKNRPAWLAR